MIEAIHISQLPVAVSASTTMTGFRKVCIENWTIAVDSGRPATIASNPSVAMPMSRLSHRASVAKIDGIASRSRVFPFHPLLTAVA